MVYNSFFDEDVWKKVNPNNKDLLEDFLLELKQMQRAESTIYAYNKDIMGFLCDVYRMFKNQYVLELSKRDIRKYSIYLQEECGVSNSRHNRIKSAVGSMMAFAEAESDYDYDSNVVRKVKGLPKESIRDIVFLTDEQILKLVDELIKQKEYQKATLIALAYDSVGRKNELRQVNKHSFMNEKINNTNKVVGKGGKEFHLLYFALTKKCAKLWLDQRGEDDVDSLWIVGSGDNVRSANKKNLYDWTLYARDLLSEIEGKEIPFNLHSFRHSGLQNYSDGSHYVCRANNNCEGFPIEKLKILANHSDISTTSDYLKDNTIEELEELFDIKIDS